MRPRSHAGHVFQHVETKKDPHSSYLYIGFHIFFSWLFILSEGFLMLLQDSMTRPTICHVVQNPGHRHGEIRRCPACFWARDTDVMMSSFQDVGLPLLTVVVLSPVAILSFRYGIPIELIVFGLLFAGYKAPKWCKGKAKQGDDGPVVQAEVVSTDAAVEKAFWRPWKARRRDEPEKSKSGKGEAKVAKPKSGAALLKKHGRTDTVAFHYQQVHPGEIRETL